MQRAIELQGFVLDRFSLPWKTASEAEKTTRVTDTLFGLDLKIKVDAPPRSRNDRPGLMVFRDAFPPKADPSRRPALLLAFIVPESPVSGLNKRALIRSLALIDSYFHDQLTDEREGDPKSAQPKLTGRKVLHLIAPCFTGSQDSLETAVCGWAAHLPQRRRYHFRIISNSANQIEENRLRVLLDNVQGGLELRLMSSAKDVGSIPTAGKDLVIVAAVDNVLHFRIFGDEGKLVVDTDEKKLIERARQIDELRKQLARLWQAHELTENERNLIISSVALVVGYASQHRISFHSMVHKATTVKEEMLKYLVDSLGYQRHDLAILIESNTGLSQAHFQREQDGALAKHEELPAEFIFPLQISEMRKAYDKNGVLPGGRLAATGSPERLAIPADEAGIPRDLPPAFTPNSSAAMDEISLTQVLTTISHRKYNAVGIVATNPFDVVFLARQVRLFCPNVRLFAIQPDLLLARPREMSFLRGMLVASTYPLYPTNQWVSTTYPARSRVFFSDQGSQGLYNATVAHLWEMGVGNATAPPLLEYSTPYDTRPTGLDRPPIWISAVGRGGCIRSRLFQTTGSVIPIRWSGRLRTTRIRRPEPTSIDHTITPSDDKSRM